MPNPIGKEENDTLLENLTTALTKTGNIEKVDFTRVDAKMTPKRENTAITLVYEGGTDGPHMLSKAPPDDSITVRRAMLDILNTINLDSLCMNLEASAALIDVAYNACNGIVGAHSNLYALRNDVLSAVGDSVTMANTFSSVSGAVTSALVDIYAKLSSGRKLSMAAVPARLKFIVKAANGLAESAHVMAEKFRGLGKRTLAEGATVVKLGEKNTEEQQKLEKQLADFKAQLDAFNVSKRELESQIAEAQALYAKYDKDARDLNKKADTNEIIGLVFGGLGEVAGAASNAVAGYYGSQTPKININSAPTPPPQPAPQPAGAKPPATAAKAPPTTAKTPAAGEAAGQGDTPDVAARQSRLGSNQAELQLIVKRLTEYENQIKVFEDEKKSKDKKREDKAIDADITAVKEKREKDSTRKKTLDTEIAADETYLKGRMASASGVEISKASKELEAKFGKAGDNARSAAAAKDKLAQEMLRLKFELEKKNTENLANIAKYTQQIKNANIESIDLSVILNSLRLAVTCLSTVGNNLQTVSEFWSSVENACKLLAENNITTDVETAVDASKDDIEALVEYVTEETNFGKNWFLMTCQWYALHSVCDAYQKSCNKARAILGESFNRPESSGAEHWKLAQGMAARLEIKLGRTILSAQSRDAEFRKRVEFAEKEKAKQLSAIFDVS